MTTQNPKIRLYKMTTDKRFAPNPYCGVLTLATCKPGIRRAAEIGEWIAGFSSKALDKSESGEEKLIYIARVDAKLSFGEYYKAYPQKRPTHCYYGDNIYKPNKGTYDVLDNPFHKAPSSLCSDGDSREKIGCAQSDCKDSNAIDLSSDNVLICAEFYYFGEKNALALESSLRDSIHLPEKQTNSGNILEGEYAQKLIDSAKAHKDKCLFVGEYIPQSI